MSMNVRLHPCSDYKPNYHYHAETVFELDKWTNVLADIVSQAKPIKKPVQIHWTAGDFEERVPQGCGPSQFDPDCTWLVDAWVIKALKIWDNHDHPDRVARAKAIQAYFNELPDDWPVIVHYT